MKKIPCGLLWVLSIFLGGCETHHHFKNHDPSLPLPEKSYEALLTAPLPPKKKESFKPLKKKEDPLPKEWMREVSLSCTDKLPVTDVMMELAAQVQVSLVIDPSVKGTVMFQAYKKPFIEVIKQLCESTKLRYRSEGGVLHIEEDRPYLKNYPLHFLNLVRQNSSKLSISTDLSSAMGANNRLHPEKAPENTSNTFLQGETKSDFWEELESNLDMILGGDNQEGTSYSLHKQAGLLIAKASSAVHQKLQVYLDLLKKRSSTQVLIEAKIIEVALSDEFQSGINWNSLKGDLVLQSPFGALTNSGAFNPATIPQKDVISLGSSGKSLTAIASLLNKFGTVRTLSSPRLIAAHQSPAIIKVTTNAVFFQVDYNREVGNSTRPDTERAQSHIQMVPIGLIMVVLPSIDPDTGKVILHLRPTISRVIGFREDPAVGVLTNNRNISEIPEVQMREMDAIVEVASEETVILGGLMEERSDNKTSGVPDMRKIPLFGALVSGKSDIRTVNELVILLRATVLNEGHESLSPADEKVYKAFTKDSRPLTFQGRR